MDLTDESCPRSRTPPSVTGFVGTTHRHRSDRRGRRFLREAQGGQAPEAPKVVDFTVGESSRSGGPFARCRHDQRDQPEAQRLKGPRLHSSAGRRRSSLVQRYRRSEDLTCPREEDRRSDQAADQCGARRRATRRPALGQHGVNIMDSASSTTRDRGPARQTSCRSRSPSTRTARLVHHEDPARGDCSSRPRRREGLRRAHTTKVAAITRAQVVRSPRASSRPQRQRPRRARNHRRHRTFDGHHRTSDVNCGSCD